MHPSGHCTGYIGRITLLGVIWPFSFASVAVGVGALRDAVGQSGALWVNMA